MVKFLTGKFWVKVLTLLIIHGFLLSNMSFADGDIKSLSANPQERNNLAPVINMQNINFYQMFSIKKEDILKKYAIPAINPKFLMQEIKASMDLAGIYNYERLIGTIINALDADAFVPAVIELAKKSGKTKEQVLEILKKNPKLKSKILRYELNAAKHAGTLNISDLSDNYLKINVTDKEVTVYPASQSPALNPGPANYLSNLLIQKFIDAQTTSFPHFDGIDDFYGRFLQLPGYGKEKPEWFTSESNLEIYGEKGLSDLRESIDGLRNFMENNLNIEEIDNVLNNGIGANEQYARRLRDILDQLVKALGINFNLQIVDNPAQILQVLENFRDPTIKNVIMWVMSRSGNTTEPADLQEILINPNAFLQILNVISWANAGRVKNLTMSIDPEQGTVYFIDNTRSDIGGRHMLELTDMVYGPLYSWLAIIGYKQFKDKHKTFDWAEKMLKVYAQGIYQTNIELMPKRIKDNNLNQAMNNAASKLAVSARRNYTKDRNKFWMVYPETLSNFIMEHAQNTNEGIAGLAPGLQRNNFIHSFSAFGDNNNDYMQLAQARPDLYQFIFFIDSNSPEAAAMRIQSNMLRSLYQIPVQVIELRIEKVNKGDSQAEVDRKLAYNLAVQARATVLMQTEVITLSHFEDKDPTSNLAVKTTRETTAESQGILMLRQLKQPGEALSFKDRIIPMKEVVENAQAAKAIRRSEWRKQLTDKIKQAKMNVNDISLPGAFNAYIENVLIPVADDLGVNLEDLAGIILAAINKTIFYSDYAESGGKKTEMVDVILDSFEAFKNMGRLSSDYSLPPLDNEVVVHKDIDNGIVMSVACEQNISQEEENNYKDKSFDDAPEVIASYYFNLLQQQGRLDTVEYFGLGYMISDAQDENIGEVKKSINENLGKFGISNFSMVFPGFSHVAIEGMQAQVERSILAFLIPTHSFPEGEGELGSLEISKGLTLNIALNVYEFGNSARMMAIGGTPGLVIFYKDKTKLPVIKQTMKKALELLSEKLSQQQAEAVKNTGEDKILEKSAAPSQALIMNLERSI
ncbi:MAG: hypothetical protein ABIG64_08150 [Candidatus Omnitrophota bacterium]